MITVWNDSSSALGLLHGAQPENYAAMWNLSKKYCTTTTDVEIHPNSCLILGADCVYACKNLTNEVSMLGYFRLRGSSDVFGVEAEKASVLEEVYIVLWYMLSCVYSFVFVDISDIQRTP